MGRPPEGLGDCQRRIRKPAHLQDAFSRNGGIVTGAELGRAYMQLAQPDGWVVRINRHGAMITQKERKKEKPIAERLAVKFRFLRVVRGASQTAEGSSE